MWHLARVIGWAFTRRLDLFVLAALRRHQAGGVWRLLFFWRRGKPPSPQQARRALEKQGPLFVKFGQVLSTRGDLLPAAFADELAKLQDKVPPAPFAEIKKIIEDAHGAPLESLFQTFDEAPVGSASVAQVHRAVLQNGREVAVKVLRPRIHQTVARDLAFLRALAFLAERLLPDGPRMRPQAVVEEFARHLDEETDLLREGANCEALRQNFADSPHLRFPKIYWEHSASAALTMEFLSGTPLSDVEAIKARGVDVARLADIGVEAFFTQVFRDRFFHADMHPGNIHVDDEGRIIVLDFGIVGRLSEFDKNYLARNFLAFFNRDYAAVARMHIAAGWTPPDTPADEFAADLRAVCEPVFAKPLGDISFGRFLGDMFRTARKYRLEVQPQLTLLQKTLLNVEGMGRALNPEINLWKTAKPFLENWAREQYGPRHALRILKQQAPDWLAIAEDMPVAVRAAMNAAKNEELRRREIHLLARAQRRQQWLIAALAIAVFILWI